MRYLESLHSAEVKLWSHKEELLGLRWQHLAPPQSFSQCDSGYSDSHSSLNDRLTPSPLREWKQFPTDPKFLGMKSAPQPPWRDRANSYLTSHLSETDSEETCSLPARRYSSSQPPMHDIHPFWSLRKGDYNIPGLFSLLSALPWEWWQLFSTCLSTTEDRSTWCPRPQ